MTAVTTFQDNLVCGGNKTTVC